MGFVTYTFIFVFLPLTLVFYYASPSKNRVAILTLASLFFYAWWRVDIMLLFVCSIFINYRFGRAISKKSGDAKKRLLIYSIAYNLGVLACFKYLNFGVDNLNGILKLFSPHLVNLSKIILPVGISFYTFHAISYLMDVYRGSAESAPSFVHFACYMALFPQLVAGPIVRYKTIAGQIVKRNHSWEAFGKGMLYFVIGLSKKVLLADSLGRMSEYTFDGSHRNLLESWLGVYGYTMQLYFDFSGYSDMAIGLGYMFGFQLPQNFDNPYNSNSITTFWRKWHISLSSFLRDYLYIPLGGNRIGDTRCCVNILIVMLFGGIWHGANWTFAVWGLYHGLLMVMERRSSNGSLLPASLRALTVPFTFVMVMFGWVFFKSSSLWAAYGLFSGLFGLNGFGSLSVMLPFISPLAIISLVFCTVLVLNKRTTEDISLKPNVATVFGCSLLLVCSIMKIIFTSYTPFLYFNF